MPLKDLTLFTQWMEGDSPDDLVPSLKLPLPKSIEVCEQLPFLDSASKALDLSSFEQLTAKRRGLDSFTWALSNYVPLSVKEKYQDLIESSLPAAETIAVLDRYFKNPTPVVIADMGSLGYGLFAKAKIKKGAVVCTYMGRLIPGDQSYDQRANIYYTVGVRSSSTLTAIFQVDTDNESHDLNIDRSELFPAFIDGSQFGNEGSFLQHLPSSAAPGVASANLITVGADYRYYPCYYFRASRDIEANEILGFDYGENYWKTQNTTPILLDKYGNPL